MSKGESANGEIDADDPAPVELLELFGLSDIFENSRCSIKARRSEERRVGKEC